MKNLFSHHPTDQMSESVASESTVPGISDAFFGLRTSQRRFGMSQAAQDLLSRSLRQIWIVFSAFAQDFEPVRDRAIARFIVFFCAKWFRRNPHAFALQIQVATHSKIENTQISV